jgi:hypothetical protein
MGKFYQWGTAVMETSNIIKFLTPSEKKASEALMNFLRECARNQDKPSEEDLWNNQYRIHENVNDDQCTMMDVFKYLDYTPEQIADFFKNPYKSDSTSRTMEEIRNTPHEPTPESYKRIYDSLLKAKAEKKI